MAATDSDSDEHIITIWDRDDVCDHCAALEPRKACPLAAQVIDDVVRVAPSRGRSSHDMRFAAYRRAAELLRYRGRRPLPACIDQAIKLRWKPRSTHSIRGYDPPPGDIFFESEHMVAFYARYGASCDNCDANRDCVGVLAVEAVLPKLEYGTPYRRRRWWAYCEAVGILGQRTRGHRVPLPVCAEAVIKRTWPERSGFYTHFIPLPHQGIFIEHEKYRDHMEDMLDPDNLDALLEEAAARDAERWPAQAAAAADAAAAPGFQAAGGGPDDAHPRRVRRRLDEAGAAVAVGASMEVASASQPAASAPAAE